MWRILRISILLFILAIATYSMFYDRLSTTDWDDTLRIGVFPINAADDDVSAAYIDRMTTDSVADIERFLNEEAKRYGVEFNRPVRVDLFPEVEEKPPAREPDAGLLATIWWSLKVRLYANRNSEPEGRAPPQIRIFVLYHDPTFNQTVPHSVGLQKGLVGVVHAFAEPGMTGSNNVVITHEILHTLGASDKYDVATLAPVYPGGYAEPDREPLYPQSYAEIMAGRYPTDENNFEMPDSLDSVLVGDETAHEIRWLRDP